MRFAIVVIIDYKSSKQIFSDWKVWDIVAILFASGNGKVPESLFLLVAKVEWLRDNRGGATSVVAVGNPSRVESIRGIR